MKKNNIVREQAKPDEKSKAMATLMLDRQERVERAAKALQEVSQKERVTLVVSSLNLSPDGRVSPVIQLVALD